MPPSIQTQRDNLNIGLYLAHGRFGATLQDVLQAALGYIHDGPVSVESHERRFRVAQSVGRDAFRNRVPGYFVFNAMPFGGQYIYKATWYVWIHPRTGQTQTVPLVTGDLASMRRLRDKDLKTREGTARSVRTAHNIDEQRQAVQRQDWSSLGNIHARMIEDGSIGEILSGFHGLPYADIEEVIDELPNRTMLFRFQREASHIRELSRRLRQAQQQVGQQLTNWVMLQTGVPNDAPRLALEQAQQRLAEL